MKKTQTTVFAFCFLCIFCGLAAAQTKVDVEPSERHRYRIDIKIDFEKLSYTGTETVRWINGGEKPASVIYFHLYPNLRVGDQLTTESDEPRIDILEVRSAGDDTALFSALEDQGTTLRGSTRRRSRSQNRFCRHGSRDRSRRNEFDDPRCEASQRGVAQRSRNPARARHQLPLPRRDAARNGLSNARGSRW